MQTSAMQVHPDPLRIIFVHGSAGSGNQWSGVVNQLPLHFWSECPHLSGPGGFSAQVDQIDDLLHQRQGTSILAGHSFGGVVAIAAALRRPHLVAGLALIEPVAFSVLDTPEYARDFAAAREFCGQILGWIAQGELEQAARAFMAFWGLEHVWAAMEAGQRASVLRAMPKLADECRLLYAPPFEAIDIAQGIRCPVMLIAGGESPPLAGTLTRAFKALLPGATVVTLPGANHLSPVFQPKQVSRAIRSFSDQLQGGK